MTGLSCSPPSGREPEEGASGMEAQDRSRNAPAMSFGMRRAHPGLVGDTV